jgi:hypothetical protein
VAAPGGWPSLAAVAAPSPRSRLKWSPGWRQRAAAAASGPTKQARAVQQRCQACLAARGFEGLEAYLRDRYVGWGSTVEPGCGRRTIDARSAVGSLA